MKKIVLCVAALLFMAVPALATTDVNITSTVDGNKVTVSYAVTGSPLHLVRAFGLDITTTGGHIVKVVPVDANYRIYPGQIVITNGEVTDYNKPYPAGQIPGNNVTIEMGSLYTMDANYSSDPNLGYHKKPSLSGTLLKFYVDGACSYSLAQNALRGGVVMEIPTEVPTVHFHSGNVLADYGDAPSPYPTLLVNNGASHLAIGPMLGANRDAEVDGQPNADATGDDKNILYPGIAYPPGDEDGITNLVATAVQGTVTVTVDSNCKLNAWVDFSNNGSWADAGEQIFTNQPLTHGVNNLVFAVPAGAVKNVDLVSRWRVNKEGGLSYTGAASNGEVEDYNRPRVKCHVPNVVGMSVKDANAAIIASGFTVGSIVADYNDYIPYHKVISQTPVYCNYPGCGTSVAMHISNGSNCYLGIGMPDEAQFNAAGRPTCWCYKRQCHGDADGKSQGKSPNIFWTSTNDLTILAGAWNTPGVIGSPGACADFDHKTQGKSPNIFRVSTNDLTIMAKFWNVAGKPDPNCPPGNRTPK
ncbi:MAG: PASTA domain-containing protein [Sedimentisphaerales bacterium]